MQREVTWIIPLKSQQITDASFERDTSQSSIDYPGLKKEIAITSKRTKSSLELKISWIGNYQIR